AAAPFSCRQREHRTARAPVSTALAQLLEERHLRLQVARDETLVERHVQVGAVSVIARREAERALSFHMLLGPTEPSTPPSPPRAGGVSKTGRADLAGRCQTGDVLAFTSSATVACRRGVTRAVSTWHWRIVGAHRCGVVDSSREVRLGRRMR